MKESILDLEAGTEGVIVDITGGQGFQRRLGTRGLRIGKRIRVVAKQFRGPIVVESEGFQITLGRGMAKKVLLEVGNDQQPDPR